jgi:hypothetical protein
MFFLKIWSWCINGNPIKNDLALMATRFGKTIKIKENWGKKLLKMAH